MSKVIDAFNSPGWIGLACNVLTVWILLGASIGLLARAGSSFGASTGAAPRDPPWTPPGAFIGAMWFLLYTLMALSLWVLNRSPAAQGTSLKLGVIVLIAFCLVWPFYAFSETSRVPGLLGNLGILAICGRGGLENLALLEPCGADDHPGCSVDRDRNREHPGRSATLWLVALHRRRTPSTR